ncbi:rhomboid family intramembrane serine protease [Belliella kenyensis]|uniref:Rhomboid family intramembrane serine protease n=1 Tax=Belliella kenyensis TaxID=1472724 RepID=A0ABV8EPB3_9BACT|nr:rhomboid family intramembrane serine protease [Belliella kenyensis]MCH7402860.1 rhomboid family intramembrane serine protease [Belliella kenyensis]MDN3602566.1 rhomboid family intramembrane serine protease [Belliella kenyensis]
MYGGFWDNLKNAFRYNNNSLYKLIAINLLVFVAVLVLRIVLSFSGAENVYRTLLSYLMMPADLGQFIQQPWTILSYMFLHEGIFHILFNMLFLYWFGLLLMEYLGSRKLANIYILGGISGALLYVLMYNVSPMFAEVLPAAKMLGASAGVYAIVVAAATLSPNSEFRLPIIGPVKIKYIAIFYVFIAFANSAGNNAGGELAHLGGAAMGFWYVYQLRKGNDWGKPVQAIGQFFESLFSPKRKIKVTYKKKYTKETQNSNYSTSSKSSTTPSYSSTTDATQEEIDDILDKIAERGYEALSKEEKRKLFEFSKK